MAAGGVSTFLYGGNANFYNLGLLEYPLVAGSAVGHRAGRRLGDPVDRADFGKALDQVAILKSFDFPTAMALPMASATKAAGVATGLRRLADAYGKPVIAYVRAEGYLAPKDIAALIDDGVVCSVKYAVERKDPADDRYLAGDRRRGRYRAHRQRYRRAAGDRASHEIRAGRLHLRLGRDRAASVDRDPRRAARRATSRRPKRFARNSSPSRTSATRIRRSSSCMTASASPASPTPGRSSPISPISTRTSSARSAPRRKRSATRTHASCAPAAA